MHNIKSIQSLKYDKLKGKIVNIFGPTASGKSQLGCEIVSKINGVIINADSMQVYHGVDILTAQPSEKENYEFYRFIPIDEYFSVNSWLNLVIGKVKRIISEGKTPILIGGTGLYFKSLIDGFCEIPIIDEQDSAVLDKIIGKSECDVHELLGKHDPALANKLHPNDKIRIMRGLEVVLATGKSILEWQQENRSEFAANDFINIYIKPDRKSLYDGINKRFEYMLTNGAVEEVEKLALKYDIANLPKIIGLRVIVAYLRGKVDHKTMLEKGRQETRNYAKRQYTWFNNQLPHDILLDQ